MADDRQLRIRFLLEAGDRVTKPLRSMAGGAREAGAALKATRDRLKDLERVQGDIGAFRQLTAGLQNTEVAMQAARAKAAALGAEYAQLEKPTRAMTRALATAERETEQLQRQQEIEVRQLGELGDRLRAAGIQTSALAHHENELQRSIEGTNRELTEQTRRFAAADDRARRFSAGRERFAKVQGAATGLAAGGAAAIGTGMAMAAPLVGSIKLAQDFESGMTDIAQKANLSRAAAEQLGKQLLISARAAVQLPSAMQAGVDTLTGFGASVPDAVAMMRPIGRAATAYKAEIGDLAAAAFAVTDNLKVPAAETARVIEMMAQAGKAGAFEVKDMATYFPALTAAYQGLGQKGVNAAGDLAAALQITRKGAGDSASAAGNLSNVLQKMASPDTIKNFEKFGIDLPKALKKAYQDGKTPIEAIAELTNKALGGTDTKIGNLDKLGFIFGDAQVQQGLRPLIQNMAEFRRIRDEAQGSASKGAVDRDFANRVQDSAEQTRQLKVNAEALGITLGSTLLPSVNRVLSGVNAFANRLSAWTAANPGFTKGLALTAAIFAALFFVLGGGAIVIAGLLAPFAALSFAAGALGIGLLPVIGIAGGVLLAIAAIAGAAYLVYANWGTVSGFFGGMWASIKSFFSSGASAIGSVFSGMWSGIKSVLSMSLMDILRAYLDFAGQALGTLYRFGSAAYAWLTGTLPGLLASGWNSAWQMLGAAFSASISWLTGRLPAMLANGWNVAWASFKVAMRTAFVTLPAMFADFGSMIIQGLMNGVKSAPGRLWNAGKSLASSLTGGFKKGADIHSPSRVFMALGGYLTQGLAIGVDRGHNGPVDQVRRMAARMAAAGAVTMPSVALAMGTVPDAARGIAARSSEATASISQPQGGRSASPAGGSAVDQAGGTTVSIGPVTIMLQQQPGQRPEDMAEAIKRQLETMGKEAAARSRSSFRDEPDWGSLD